MSEQDLKTEDTGHEADMPATAGETQRRLLEDTDRIQKAIELVADQETAAIPPLPFTGVPADGTPEETGSSRDGFPPEPPRAVLREQASIHAWFFTFMCMNIPIAGWVYLFYLAFNKQDTGRKYFAKAYLFYKLVFLAVSLVILGILVYIGLELLDQLLAYMEML